MKSGSNKIVWYAAGGGIFKAGPFETEIEAWKAMELREEVQLYQRSVHPRDTRVWPEYENEL